MSAVESSTRSSTSSSSVDAELGEHAARVADGARAVGQALVPVGRRAEQAARIAGAQRADDHVVHAVGVLDGDEDRAPARGRCRARAPPRARRRAGARLYAGSTHARATTPRAVGRRPRHEPVDPLAHVLVGDDALLDQQRLERADARGGRRLVAVGDRRVVVVVLVVAHSRLLEPVLEDVDEEPVVGVAARSRATRRAARSRRGTAAARGARRCRRRASRGCGTPAWTRSTVPVLPLR